MTLPLFLADAYLRATPARVIAVHGHAVELDRTVLYAESGGQAADHGTLTWTGGEARVIDSQFAPDTKARILHTLDGPLPPVGAEVNVALDWPRRHGLMRNHTAAHVLAAILHHDYKAAFTGGQLYPDRGRADIEFAEWRPELKDEIERKVNTAIDKDFPVQNRTIPRAEFEARSDLLRTKENLVDPSLTEVRLTDIVGLDCQADGGTHVRSTREIGRVLFGKVENKGKGHRRLSWTLA